MNDRIKKILLRLGNKALAVILIAIVLDLLFGLFLLYRYVIQPGVQTSEVTIAVMQFNNKAHQSLLKTLQEREEVFTNASFKTYPDPFYWCFIRSCDNTPSNRRYQSKPGAPPAGGAPGPLHSREEIRT